jgi:large subunit ribosomal protein L30
VPRKSRKLRVKQVRSSIKRPKRQKETLRALGLRKIGSWRIHEDKPEIRGMIRRVNHLIETEPVEETDA